MGCNRDIYYCSGSQSITAWVCLWHYRFSIRFLQLLRGQYDIAIQENRSLARLSVWGESIYYPQSYCQSTAGLAGILPSVKTEIA